MKTVIAIIMTNVDGGGTLRHAIEMSSEWSRQGNDVVFIQTFNQLIKVYLYKHGIVNNMIRFWDKDGNHLLSFLQECHIGMVHIEHLLNAEPYVLSILKKLHVPLVVTLHDYYFACPFIKMTDMNETYCGEKGEQFCDECLVCRGYYSITLKKTVYSIKQWRNFWLSFLQVASLVIVPSKDMEKRIRQYFPLKTIKIRENPELISPASPKVQVGLIGNLSMAKGARVIKDVLSMAVQKKSLIHFTLFGTLSDVKLTSEESRYITILGPYKEKDIYQMISCYDINYFWFPGVCLETYSYTLSIPIRLHIPCLSSDIGAIASRIKTHHWGETYPWNEEAVGILKKMMSFEYHKFYNPNFIIDNISFGNFEKFYEGIQYKKINELPQETVQFTSPYNELPDILSKSEFNELWKGASLTEKRKILAHVDKSWLKSVWKEKGAIYFLKKIKEKVMK